MQEVEPTLVELLSKYPPLKEVAQVRTGSLHVTPDEISDKPTGYLLIHPRLMKRYFVNVAPLYSKHIVACPIVHSGGIRWVDNSGELNESESGALICAGKIIRDSDTHLEPRLMLSVMPEKCIADKSLRVVIPKKEDSMYLLALLNSRLISWYFLTQKNPRRGYVGCRALGEIPIPRISAKKQEPFKVLAKCVLFLKQYDEYIKPDNHYHVWYMGEYFDHLIDCLVYELYIKDLSIPEFLKQSTTDIAEELLDSLDPPENVLEAEPKEVERSFREVSELFDKFDANKDLSQNLYTVQFSPYVEEVRTALEELQDKY